MESLDNHYIFEIISGMALNAFFLIYPSIVIERIMATVRLTTYETDNNHIFLMIVIPLGWLVGGLIKYLGDSSNIF
jgi:hypothetical protein